VLVVSHWVNNTNLSFCAPRAGRRKENAKRSLGGKRTISIQQFKLSDEVSGYDLYYSLTPPSSESSLGLKLAQTHFTLCLIFIK